MSVTKKLIILSAVGILLIPFMGSDSGTVFLLFNCVLIALVTVDYFITPKADVFDIWRHPEDKLFFKAVNTVSFQVRNNHSLPFEVILKDELPDFHFQIAGNDMQKVIPPQSEVCFSYDTVPTKRGAFLFANIYIKYKSSMGLIYKYAKRPLACDFKVYPNLRDLSKYRLLIQKNMALENGKRIINIRGRGQEFESLREYAQGDDYRTINFPVSARAGKYVVNLYESEKNQPIFIMIDTGRPMSYLLRGYKKLDYAINAALILSDIVNQKGDASGLVVFGRKTDAFLKPGKGPAHRNNLMEALYHIEDTNETSGYYNVFREFVSRQKRRSVVFIFTDFETEVEQSDLVSQIGMLKVGHLPVVMLMKNESAIHMAENSSTQARGVYERFAAVEYLDNRRALIRALNKNGIVCVESDCETFAIDAVNRYLDIKARRGL